MTIIEIDKLTPILIYSPIQALLKEHFNRGWFLNINKKTKLSFTMIIFCHLQMRLFKKQ